MHDANFSWVNSQADPGQKDLWVVGNMRNKKFIKGKMHGYQTLNFEA